MRKPEKYESGRFEDWWLNSRWGLPAQGDYQLLYLKFDDGSERVGRVTEDYGFDAEVDDEVAIWRIDFFDNKTPGSIGHEDCQKIEQVAVWGFLEEIDES